MIDTDLVAACLRFLVYVGSIAIAGTVLFQVSFPRASAQILPLLNRQILFGFILLLLVEPLRYGVFQLASAGGDWALAFGPDLRWMAFQTPIGQAALLRLVTAAIVIIAGARLRTVALAGAVVLISSFLLEGHTAGSEARPLVAPLLFVHLAAVHWWLGALVPLLALTYRAESDTTISSIESFGRRAVCIVIALLTAGVILAVLLTGGVVNLDDAYQQRLLIKLALVALLLSIAAFNKLRLTPQLRLNYALACARLRASIRLEVGVAIAILVATAWLVGTAPRP